MKAKMKLNYVKTISSSLKGGPYEPALQMNGESEKNLVEKMAKGDSSAFEMLIAQHARKVYFSVHRITKNREDAEDAMQDAFIKAYTHIASFEGRSRFHTWFTTIAINQALMCMRRRKYWVSLPVSAGEEQDHSLPEIPDERPSADVELEERELANLLGKETSLLPPLLRSVFRLRAFDGLSTNEVAQTLGISISAVKARMLRARRHLERRIAEHGSKPRLAETPGSR
jgi:RNA polymerase sigma-70 factor, ECF subfamily